MNLRRSGTNGVIGAERRRKIREWASVQGWVNVASLAGEFGVTPDTIRADLDKLEKEGILVRTHGGAVAKGSPKLRPPYSETRDTYMPEKSAIGEAALAYLPSSGSIYIGPGSTTHEMVKQLPKELQIQIYTDSLPHAQYLVANSIAPVQFPGGVISLPAFVSDWSMSPDALDDLYWDVMFTGAPAIDIDRGISEASRQGAAVVRKLMEHSETIVMLCDSSKIGSVSHATIAPVDMIDVFITDTGADREFIDLLNGQDVEVIMVDPHIL